ncbi:MAG: glycosyltransferase family 4 protein [Acidimicrobiia bacterium]|nr:glycosyltransferase family 4 protein [Acidimicrobiia bacterium]
MATVRRAPGEVPRALGALRKGVRAVEPDIVHFQSEIVPRLDPIAVRVIRRHAPVVITAHDPVPHEAGAHDLERQARVWRSADAVVIHGEDQRRVVDEYAPGTDVRVIPVDLRLGGPRVTRTTARSQLGLGSEPIALLLGLLRSYKGLALLADAWPAVVRKIPAARLAVVGATIGPVPELELLRAAPKVDVRRGFVADDEVDLWAAAADVLALPYAHGSHSGILHRGLAMGTPVLASPPLADEVLRTQAGRVVPLESDAWSAALTAALGADPIPPPPEPRGVRTVADTLVLYRDLLDERRRGRAK